MIRWFAVVSPVALMAFAPQQAPPPGSVVNMLGASQFNSVTFSNAGQTSALTFGVGKGPVNLPAASQNYFNDVWVSTMTPPVYSSGGGPFTRQTFDYAGTSLNGFISQPMVQNGLVAMSDGTTHWQLEITDGQFFGHATTWDFGEVPADLSFVNLMVSASTLSLSAQARITPIGGPIGPTINGTIVSTDFTPFTIPWDKWATWSIGTPTGVNGEADNAWGYNGPMAEFYTSVNNPVDISDNNFDLVREFVSPTGLAPGLGSVSLGEGMADCAAPGLGMPNLCQRGNPANFPLGPRMSGSASYPYSMKFPQCVNQNGIAPTPSDTGDPCQVPSPGGVGCRLAPR